MKYALVFVLLSSVGLAQQNGRYQIIQIASVADKSEAGMKLVQQSTATEKDVILLDTQTGKTWMLTPTVVSIGTKDHPTNGLGNHWTPIPFGKFSPFLTEPETPVEAPQKKKW